MERSVLVEGWRLAWKENAKVCAEGFAPKTVQEVEDSGLRILQATVPGSYELDFMREGILEDVYFGANVLETQKLENLHLYYFTEFTFDKRAGFDAALCFAGIDTVAEIFLDGELLGFVENMLHAHTFDIGHLSEGKHELVVHILPAAIYARQFEIPAMCWGMKYNHDAITLRKPGSMFGWDIMPRIVSGGLWKPVTVEYKAKTRIEDAFTYLNRYHDSTNTAIVSTVFKIITEEDFLSDFFVEVVGRCASKGKEFRQTLRPFCASCKLDFPVKDPALWWPKGYGDQDMYEVEIRLLKGGVEVDKTTQRIGLRSVWIKRTSQSGANGDFCFIVNGKRVFVMGTNWVPCDAIPARHDEYTLRNVRLADEQGCNMIRCWGGNAYPSDLFYDYCDEHGIMVWQDFSLACGHYPDDERLCGLMKEEVKQVAKALRAHPSLTVWAGDNECDVFITAFYAERKTDAQRAGMIDPNFNALTRGVILRELRNHDATRPYLPSSPYLDETAFRYGAPSEDHLWGPRDFFKGEYYSTAECHFASEIGYHGCPSPASIQKFISAESLPKQSIYEICDNPEWLVHAAGMETEVEGNPYSYRLPLMISQVERIFTTASGDLSEFARQSQVSQAEADKFFIETFRIQKGRKTGILWWNIVDGWPQVSDAVVDWYGCKKIAYHYIRRSQQTLCLMCDEPKNGVLSLIAASDLQENVAGRYEVIDLSDDTTVAEGEFSVLASGVAEVAKLPAKKGGFYLIRWESVAGSGVNHFVCNIGEGWTWESYRACMQKAGFYDEFEGF